MCSQKCDQMHTSVRLCLAHILWPTFVLINLLAFICAHFSARTFVRTLFCELICSHTDLLAPQICTLICSKLFCAHTSQHLSACTYLLRIKCALICSHNRDKCADLLAQQNYVRTEYWRQYYFGPQCEQNNVCENFDVNNRLAQKVTKMIILTCRYLRANLAQKSGTRRSISQRNKSKQVKRSTFMCPLARVRVCAHSHTYMHAHIRAHARTRTLTHFNKVSKPFGFGSRAARFRIENPGRGHPSTPGLIIKQLSR